MVLIVKILQQQNICVKTFTKKNDQFITSGAAVAIWEKYIPIKLLEHSLQLN